jgi:CheY-like chemotaxis protein
MIATRADNPGARILIVDDNELGLLARRQVLTELGHHVTVVSSAEEAVRRFAVEPFDLVVTDYKMPEMNGVEMIRRLRAHKADVPVILISGFTQALGLSEAETGADVVLQKSANEVVQLIRAVNRLLRTPAPKKRATLQGRSAAASKRAG